MSEEKKLSKPANPDPALVLELKKSASPANPDPRLVNLEKKGGLPIQPAEQDPRLWHIAKHSKK